MNAYPKTTEEFRDRFELAFAKATIALGVAPTRCNISPLLAELARSMTTGPGSIFGMGRKHLKYVRPDERLKGTQMEFLP